MARLSYTVGLDIVEHLFSKNKTHKKRKQQQQNQKQTQNIPILQPKTTWEILLGFKK